MDLGLRIRELRKKRGLSQDDLGKAIGVTGSNLSRVESGEQSPRADLLVKLARFFAVTTDYLLGLSDRERELSVELRELLELAEETGYTGDLKSFLLWLKEKRDRTLGKEVAPDDERDARPRFASYLAQEEIDHLFEKYGIEFIKELESLPGEFVGEFTDRVQDLLYYYGFKAKVDRAGKVQTRYELVQDFFNQLSTSNRRKFLDLNIQRFLLGEDEG